jgi:hypothetical protein
VSREQVASAAAYFYPHEGAHASRQHQHCRFRSFVSTFAGAAFILTAIIQTAITIAALAHPSFATSLAQTGGSPALAVLKTPFI